MAQAEDLLTALQKSHRQRFLYALRAWATVTGSWMPNGQRWEAQGVYRLKAGKIARVRMPLMGVRKKYQGGAMGAGLAYTVIEKVHENVRHYEAVGKGSLPKLMFANHKMQGVPQSEELYSVLEMKTTLRPLKSPGAAP